MCSISSTEKPYISGMSRAGTITGGWLMIRYRPSTISASFDSACVLSRVRAFSAILAAFFWSVFACFLSAPFASRAAAPTASITSWAETFEYQISITPMSANRNIASR